MGVLEARENAEKIGYPVVWENIKDADNVIDYNINEEITKDASGVMNANNQTTTGMATVIPWINAPKLIASTSVTGIPEWDWYFYWWVDLYQAHASVNVPANSSVVIDVTDCTFNSQRWYYTWEYVSWKWLIFPSWWWWEIIYRYSGSDSDTKKDYEVYIGNTLIASHTGSYNADDYTETLHVNAKKWDALWFKCTITNKDSYSHSQYARNRIKISRWQQ